MASAIVLLLLAFFAFVSAYEVVQNAKGQQFYLVHRQRRQTNIDIAKSNSGARITAGHQGTFVNNNGHRLDGSAFASKQFRPSGPGTIGGQLGYSHVPSGSNLNVGAQHTQRLGTNVGATGNVNLWRNGNSSLDAVGSYNKNFGGFGGSNYFAGLEYKMKYGY